MDFKQAIRFLTIYALAVILFLELGKYLPVVVK
jgi:hypothetical protein